MGERKLVEAFRTFFERTVAPHVSQNDQVMREWNHLNKIITSDPIDYSGIEFYLLLANKNSGSAAKGSQQNIGSFNKIPDNDPSSKFRQSDFNLLRSDRLEKRSATQTGSKKKNLIASLQSFQRQLLQNQERLEGLGKRDQGGVNTSANGVPLRRY